MQAVTASISSKHQVVIPKAVREALGMGPDDQLLFVINGDTVIVRVEQLYPLPTVQMLALLQRRYPNAKQLVWLQEEPENMGAWRFMWPILREVFGREPRYAGRAASGSPATGSLKVHLDQQAKLVDEALGV